MRLSSKKPSKPSIPVRTNAWADPSSCSSFMTGLGSK